MLPWCIDMRKVFFFGVDFVHMYIECRSRSFVWFYLYVYGVYIYKFYIIGYHILYSWYIYVIYDIWQITVYIYLYIYIYIIHICTWYVRDMYKGPSAGCQVEVGLAGPGRSGSHRVRKGGLLTSDDEWEFLRTWKWPIYRYL